MKNTFCYLSGLFYLLLLLADVLALALDYPDIHVWVKPLLMPALFMLLLAGAQKENLPGWIFAAFGVLMAWAGDVFLIFETKNPLFFLAGLASFLGTHICYILFFSKMVKPHKAWWLKNAWVWLAIITYGIILMATLWPHLGGMKWPVLIYASCICLMVMLSIRIQPDMVKSTWAWFATGAFLFLISDSILALNKFREPVDFASPMIMLTYGLAQFFIVSAAIRLSKPVAGAG